MNGFKILADAHRTVGQERKADLYDFLATCSQEDFCTLFDSTAFNDISKKYLSRACAELIEENVLTEEQGERVRTRFSTLFSEMSAEEII